MWIVQPDRKVENFLPQMPLKIVITGLIKIKGFWKETDLEKEAKGMKC